MGTSVLIIDDSTVARRLILDTLQQAGMFDGYLEAGNGQEGFDKLLRFPVDVVLCDLEMPGTDGFKLLELVNARPELRDIPVIILTGQESQDDKIRGLEHGASDYVTKPFHPGELIARVRVQLKIKLLQDSLKESNRELERLSLTDPLTGLANRRHFFETLERHFEQHRRTGMPLALVMLDIDHFKRINDSYGHQGGDQVLAATAALLGNHMRQYDLAARYGGEEFTAILPEVPLAEALNVAERLRLEFCRLLFPPPLTTLQLTVSLGVAALPSPGLSDVDHLIEAADSALYRAKRNGRNRVEAMRL